MDENYDVLRHYLSEMRKIPLLTAEQEKTLLKLAQAGDMKARERLINSNLRLVVSIAKKYCGCGLPLSDLIEEGNLGLIKTMEKFNPDTGNRLSTYATWWIRQNIVRALAIHARLIRLPVNLGERVTRFIRVREDLLKKLERAPDPSELASEMGLKPGQINQIIAVVQFPLSLDTEIDDQEGNSLKDVLPDTNAISPEESFIINQRKETIDRLLNLLSSREREILKLRFGLNGNGGVKKSLAETGKNFGITRERVRQIERMALKKLRNFLQRRKGITLSELL